MTRRELRQLRLQLELLKPEMILAERGIRSTVVMFGGARIPGPGGEAWAAKEWSGGREPWGATAIFEEARKFARLCRGMSLVVAVANCGGDRRIEPASWKAIAAPMMSAARHRSPQHRAHEQAPNSYVTPICSISTISRSGGCHFVMHAKAIAVLPGGFGTMDDSSDADAAYSAHRARASASCRRTFWEKAIDLVLADQEQFRQAIRTSSNTPKLPTKPGASWAAFSMDCSRKANIGWCRASAGLEAAAQRCRRYRAGKVAPTLIVDMETWRRRPGCSRRCGGIAPCLPWPAR